MKLTMNPTASFAVAMPTCDAMIDFADPSHMRFWNTEMLRIAIGLIARTSVLICLGYLSQDVQAQVEVKPATVTQVEWKVREISGWQVFVAKKLLEAEAEDTAKALAGLEKMLDEIVREVPAAAVAELRKVPLYFSPSYQEGRSGAEFHPRAGWLRENGRDSAMAQGVEFSGVHDFEAEMRRMPNFALHELAHAYHFRVLPDGFNNAEIKAAFQRAKESGAYELVERRFGDDRSNSLERAYAMTNAME
ncbi:MAG: hypothetical protein KF851_02625 [Pirellulaceae bacterium]|nr:hypothetical protein [Pirellulaceae bacterium]